MSDEKMILNVEQEQLKLSFKKLKIENSPPLVTVCQQKQRMFTCCRLEEWQARFEEIYVVQDVS